MTHHQSKMQTIIFLIHSTVFLFTNPPVLLQLRIGEYHISTVLVDQKIKTI